MTQEASPENVLLTYINEAIQNINEVLERYGHQSRVSVIDFTHFTKDEEHDNKYHLNFLIFGQDKYLEILKKAKEKFGSYSLFIKNTIRYVCNLGYASEELNLDDPPVRNETEETEIKDSERFDPKDWHLDLMKEHFGGYSIIYARKIAKDQSAVYIILSSPIDGSNERVSVDLTDPLQKNELSKPLQACLNEIYQVLDRVLIDELARNLHAIWQRSEMQRKVIIAKEKERENIFHILMHSQKQYLRALQILAKRLDADNKDLLDYLTESITGFLEVVSLYKKNELHVIGVEYISIADEIRKLVDVFENLILIDKDILSCTLQKSGHDRVINLNKKNNSPAKIFGGNFRTVKTEIIESLETVPRLILKEAIVNALEHCDEEDPSVIINLEEEQDELLIIIKNNGSATEEQLQLMRNPAEASSKLGWYFIHFFFEKILTNWNVKEIDYDDIENVTWYTFQIKK